MDYSNMLLEQARVEPYGLKLWQAISQNHNTYIKILI